MHHDYLNLWTELMSKMSLALTKFSIISSALCFVRLRVDSHLIRSISHKLLTWNRGKKVLTFNKLSLIYLHACMKNLSWVNNIEISRYGLSREWNLQHRTKMWKDIPRIGCELNIRKVHQIRHWRVAQTWPLVIIQKQLNIQPREV